MIAEEFAQLFIKLICNAIIGFLVWVLFQHHIGNVRYDETVIMFVLLPCCFVNYFYFLTFLEEDECGGYYG